jgi:CDP-diacylglycerol--serine O-phosphatidyltransferase
VAVLILVVITIKPAVILFSVVFLYAFSGPLLTLITLRQRRLQRKEQREPKMSDAKTTGQTESEG